MYRVDFIYIQSDGKTEYRVTVCSYQPGYFFFRNPDVYYHVFSAEDVALILIWLKTVPFTVKQIILRPIHE